MLLGGGVVKNRRDEVLSEIFILIAGKERIFTNIYPLHSTGTSLDGLTSRCLKFFLVIARTKFSTTEIIPGSVRLEGLLQPFES